MPFRTVTAALLVATGLAAVTPATDAPQTPVQWITLGTKGGPVPNAVRSQPANLLVTAAGPWLVDCGDGAMERLAAAGFKPTDLDVVLISHLHMDHIGGLQGLIGLRWMMGAERPLTIYGPPGTQSLVDGLIASLAPSLAIARHEAMRGGDLAKLVKVVTLVGGSRFSRDGVAVTAARNSHFDEPPGHPLANGSQSLSYRFDAPARSITYTGDTGPSAAVVALARGSDLLVSEVMDMDRTREVYAAKTDMPPARKAQMLMHLADQHLSPQAAGRLAAAAHVKALVFTHLGLFDPVEKVSARLVSEAHETYPGPVTVARDLDRF